MSHDLQPMKSLRAILHSASRLRKKSFSKKIMEDIQIDRTGRILLGALFIFDFICILFDIMECNNYKDACVFKSVFCVEVIIIFLFPFFLFLPTSSDMLISQGENCQNILQIKTVFYPTPERIGKLFFFLEMEFSHKLLYKALAHLN